MKLSEQEKAAKKAAFRAMPTAKKLEHIFIYYKWLILLGLIALFIFGTTLRRTLTQKEPVLYLALVNVGVGSEMESSLNDGFLRYAGADGKRQEVYLYRDLYLSENADTLNHEYAYASRMKLMGSIQTQKLDIAIMNREGYDLCSQKGYLADLPSLLADDPALSEQLTPLLTENEVVLSDNSIDVMLKVAEEEIRVTQSVPNALSLSSLPLFQQAGFDSEIYLGILVNSQRTETALDYIRYRFSFLYSFYIHTRRAITAPIVMPTSTCSGVCPTNSLSTTSSGSSCSMLLISSLRTTECFPISRREFMASWQVMAAKRKKTAKTAELTPCVIPQATAAATTVAECALGMPPSPIRRVQSKCL